MSDIRSCPTCGAKARYTEEGDPSKATYNAVQDEEAFKKVEKLKAAFNKFKDRCEELEAQLAAKNRTDG